jgi:16S rRNA (adenine1518-N6/adenine1519-N6)-dimethyltransferase
MLRSALAPLAGSSSAAEAAVRAAGLDPTSRGEAVDVAAFARIAEQLAARAAGPGSPDRPEPRRARASERPDHAAPGTVDG